MATSDEILRPGINFTNWPELKLAHGVAAGRTLRTQVDVWNAAGNLITKKIRPASNKIETRLHVIVEPPVDEWSLLLGDALHSFRSSLDAIAWALAHIDGLSPAKPRDIYFPISNDESQWEKTIAPFKHTPVVIQDRLLSVQPFRLYPYDTESPLQVLHRLDIDDKHRGLLRAGALVEGLNVNMSIATDRHARLRMSGPARFPPHIEEDELLGRITSEAGLRTKPGGGSHVAVMPIMTLDGETHDAIDMIEGLGEAVRFVLNSLYGGVDYAIMMAKPFLEKDETDGTTEASRVEASRLEHLRCLCLGSHVLCQEISGCPTMHRWVIESGICGGAPVGTSSRRTPGAS